MVLIGGGHLPFTRKHLEPSQKHVLVHKECCTDTRMQNLRMRKFWLFQKQQEQLHPKCQKKIKSNRASV